MLSKKKQPLALLEGSAAWQCVTRPVLRHTSMRNGRRDLEAESAASKGPSGCSVACGRRARRELCSFPSISLLFLDRELLRHDSEAPIACHISKVLLNWFTDKNFAAAAKSTRTCHSVGGKQITRRCDHRTLTSRAWRSRALHFGSGVGTHARRRTARICLRHLCHSARRLPRRGSRPAWISAGRPGGVHRQDFPAEQHSLADRDGAGRRPLRLSRVASFAALRPLRIAYGSAIDK